MAKVATEQLLDFKYSGTNKRGQNVKGELTAKSLELARAQLRKQGIIVQDVRQKSKPLFQIKKSIKAIDIAIFVRQLATMMKAGVPLTQAFEIVADSLDNPSMKEIVLKVKADIEAGSNFATALRKHPKYFDDLFCSLVESGEQSGALETMLERVATYKEKSEMLKAKIKKAMKYPIAVIIVAIIVTAILLVKVVPVFADMFAGFGAELPAFTQMVVNMSNWMVKYYLVFFIVLAILVVSFTQAKLRSQKFRNFLDRLALKLPIFGDIVYKSIIARFCRTLSTTFAAGVPLIDALDSTAGATNNIVFYEATQRVKEDVATGQQMQFAMRNTNLFPSMVLQMVGIGEEAGSLEEMLDKAATFYENEVDNAVDGLTSLMEPMIMAFLGVVIGGLVIAMYLPIFMMGDVIG
ncbi:MULTISPECIES: type II secretion system F family protein [Moraxella]|uniref:Type II secretion system protein F n=1 Tax=Moraxella lacunata TaxID=477 RepID=A0A1B8PV41_MORLA|nr:MULTISPECIES: type II secretion system F family protein [Moraxella]MBE9579150.1 type II secretion system F family protein [Moraxella sp. K1664]MBE9588436.1 type II secretion system F family protein [Moraxella sp. K1630]MBE9596596.1 type II secretion system F family protein [Moraxella sp. K2450]MDH9219148.1 type II secretion system F family protein [Moraxella lacunata]MDI4483149.1 type II secretion system F family protein [Moraxella lacunata]